MLSSGLWGAADYLAGRISRTHSILLVLLVSQCVGLVMMVLIATVSGSWSAFSDDLILPAAGAGLSGVLGLALYYRALATGTMGVVSPIAALGGVVPVAVGLDRGEQPTALQVAGIMAALIGVVLASGPEVRGEVGRLPVLLALASALLLGISLTLIARGSTINVVMTMTGMRLTTVVALTCAVLVARPNFPRPRGFPALSMVGAMDVSANLAFGVASTLGLLSLVSVFGSLYPVTTIILARLLDGERLARVQQIGVLLALLGAAAISAG